MAEETKAKKADKSDIKVMLKEAFVLLMITLFSGLMLGFVYELTKEPIAKQEELAVQNACSQVVKEADHFVEVDCTVSDYTLTEIAADGVTIGKVYEAYAADDSFLGFVIEAVTSKGYGGNIDIYIGVLVGGSELTLEGVSILSISETPGLGMRAEEVLVPQFANTKVSQFTYTKNGKVNENEIDAISGATITTKAFVGAVNGGMKAADELYVRALSEGRVTVNEEE